MNRETRKANLRKLQLPGTGNGTGVAIRKTRSSKVLSTQDSAISRYFSTELPNNPEKEIVPSKQNETSNKNPCMIIIDSTIIENKKDEEKSPQHSPKVANENKEDAIEQTLWTKRTKLNSFLSKGNEIIPLKQLTQNDDFETNQKKTKAAPKVKTKSNTTTKPKKAKTRSKRQQDIKSAFLRNEQLFSEITAQHCLADDINPDEMQLALAISKSEAETSGIITIEDEEVVVDIATNANNADESIRTKLKRYGFRTAPIEEFSNITTALRTGFTSRKKSKWANKFTALTLRDPEQQLKKVNQKLNDFFNKQCSTKALTEEESHIIPYRLNSAILKRIRPKQHAELFKKAENLTTANLENFYVKKLFEISCIMSGYLLKDWSSIQGRDLSPCKRSTQQKSNEALLFKIYIELENYFCKESTLENETISMNSFNTGNETNKQLQCLGSDCELDEMVDLIENLNSQEGNINGIFKSNLDNNSPNKEPPEKKLKPEVTIEIEVAKQNRIIKSNLDNNSPNKEPPEKKLKPDVLNEIEVTKQNVTDLNAVRTTQINLANNKDAIPLSSLKVIQSNRAMSPDIFAESDVETDEDDVNLAKETEKLIVKSNSIETKNGIEIFEKYSSDEVKTIPCIAVESSKDKNVKNSDSCMIVDLTEDDSNSQDKKEAEALLGNHIFNGKKQQNSFFEDLSKNVFALNSPLCNSDVGESSFGATNDTIFEALRRKYLGSGEHTVRGSRKSISFTQVNELRKSLSKSKRHLSFTQMEQKIMQSIEDVSPKLEKKIKTPVKNVGLIKEPDSPVHLEVSFTTKSQNESSIDLTQNEDSAEECIVLSDDEINYSIWKADKTMNLSKDKSISTNDIKSADNSVDLPASPILDHSETPANNFSYHELLNVNNSFNTSAYENAGNISCTQACLNLDIDVEIEPIKSQYLATQTDIFLCSPTPETPKLNDLSKERAEFGILDSCSEPLTETPLKTPTKQISTADISFLTSPSEIAAPMKRYSRSTSSHKFGELLKNIEDNTKPTTSYFDDFDEFDKLVFGTPKMKSPQKPIGFEQLLTAEISFHEERQQQCYKTPKKLYVSPKKNLASKVSTPTKSRQELLIDNRIYIVRVTTSPKPDFNKQTDAELLKQLYKFGIKPLKRSHALKMLEYIYNQTHPILVDESEPTEMNNPTATTSNEEQSEVFKMNSKPVGSQDILNENTNENMKRSGANKFNLSDCFGDLLLQHRYHLSAELSNEEYIFQTNISKKIAQALLPLHVAWYNLICSNKQLHEAILMYEPIDLQEIYLFFKSLGYRYDPKDLKIFFDSRCIIFRYDLSQPGTNRHVRKNKKKTTTK